MRREPLVSPSTIGHRTYLHVSISTTGYSTTYSEPSDRAVAVNILEVVIHLLSSPWTSPVAVRVAEALPYLCGPIRPPPSVKDFPSHCGPPPCVKDLPSH